MPVNKDFILFLDLETTGNLDEDEIIEIGCVLMDSKSLQQVSVFSAVIAPSPEAMARMMENTIVRHMHEKNGLLQDVARTNNKMSTGEVDNVLCFWLNGFCHGTNHVPYGGSGVTHFDRKFINKYLPKFAKRLTYWAYDMGCVRRTFELADGPVMSSPPSGKAHRALDDACYHANELRFYCQQARNAWKYEDLR
jgi:oligoribonuclease